MRSFSILATLASLGAVSAAASSAVPTSSMTSCPAPGTTNADGDYSCNPAHQYPEGQTCELVDGCYFLRAVVSSTASIETTAYPQPTQTGCAAPGATNAAGQYSCNPAHQYPEGQTCVLENGCYILVDEEDCTTTTTGAHSKPTQTSCAAPGTTNTAGKYSCNPAHQYPEGQVCVLEDGCYILIDEDDCTTTSTGAPPKPTQTSCAAPGSTNAAGQYSCNPAHQYPQGQTCVLEKGCYVLVDEDDCTTTTGAPPKPTQTSCPAPGSTNAAGQYSCNPAHQYPEGQSCVLENGCYVLIDEEDCTTTTVAPPKPTQTGCPAPGSTNAAGQYSCNPAHQYPAGQTCELVNGCYFLVTPSGTPSNPTKTGVSPQPTAACPAPGSTNANGDYSCNPAHSYPAGQACILVDGCYFLRPTGMSTVPVVPRPTSNSTTPVVVPTGVPAGASGVMASPVSVFIGLISLALFAL